MHKFKSLNCVVYYNIWWLLVMRGKLEIETSIFQILNTDLKENKAQ